jgi:hypothetical protein
METAAQLICKAAKLACRGLVFDRSPLFKRQSLARLNPRQEHVGFHSFDSILHIVASLWDYNEKSRAGKTTRIRVAREK